MDWSNLLYLIIGGLISLLTTIISQHYINKYSKQKYEREIQDKKDTEIRNKKEEFFINVVNLLTAITAEKNLSTETKIKHNNIRAYFVLYLNQEWCDRYWDLSCYILETRSTESFNLDKVTQFNSELKIALFEN